ncbi:MAG: hypothetical protein SV765_11180 [Pseudomonadota bacterium]|nr:hypothetical protein [Pseudomonadales bacterium]MDY6920759.1 hypothetical protein [Pseudomonadota bacterium]
MKYSLIFGILLLVLMAPVRAAQNFEQRLLDLQHQWATINYETPEAQREDAFAGLAQQAEGLIQAYPQRPEPLVWKGIIVSTWAGARGGLGALKLVKEAKSLLEQSLELDPDALSGSAYTSLGSLYYQVPGWPLGFGDDEQAERLLKQALKVNPDGIDSNYFYADYCLDQGDADQARIYFEKALQAPPRPERPLADAGRRQEILAKLNSIKK